MADLHSVIMLTTTHHTQPWFILASGVVLAFCLLYNHFTSTN